MSKIGEGVQPVKIVLIMLGISLWSLSILVRLVQLQIVEHDEHLTTARKKQTVTRSVLAPRGVIYDSHLDELATNVKISSLEAIPKRIQDKPAAARQIASILGLDSRKLLSGMLDPKHESYLRIKRRIDPEAESRIKSLEIDGVYFVDESMRVYPNRELAAQTLGFVNMNDDAGAGIELKYDRELKGTDGLFSFDIDARQKSFRLNIEKPPVQGHSLILSIDKSIQYITDRELAAGVKNAKAKSGIAVVMESDTGRILALSNYPSFNCNTYNDYGPELWRNRAVSDMFEPGSTFKVVVAAAALEAKLTRPDELIDCQNGSITLGGHPFRDHGKGYGLLTFKEVLEHSSNVGAIKLGLRLGPRRLYEALRNFGFGKETGVDLPGEIVGLVRDWNDWSGLSIGAISFGQEVGVTSMQILTAINAIANGGFRVRPSIVDRIIDENGIAVSEHRTERIPLMSPRTAEAVTEAFEGVVLRGTGKNAALEGYRAAGKTGTAQKSINGRYAAGKYMSSFIGFAPLPNPRVTILVQIDEPQNGYYGGDVSAPYFRNIAQEVLLQLRIPPDPGLPLPEYAPAVAVAELEDFLPETVPVAGMNPDPQVESQSDTVIVPVDSNLVALPDFLGMSKRTVLDRCIDLGIRLDANGSGVAILQSPPPGTKVPVGSVCSVTFSKNGVKENVAALGTPHQARRAAAVNAQ